MRRQTTLTVSCGGVLKAKAQTMIFKQVQFDDDYDRESVTSSKYISNGTEEDIVQTYHITLIEDGGVEEEDAKDAPLELEEGIKANIDELKEVILSNIEDPRPIYISTSLTQEEEEEETYIALLNEFKDVFAWSYKEMSVLDPKVVVHHLGPNNLCPKDDFPLSIVELMIDAKLGHEALSFMDRSSGYNQIHMVLVDEELTAFHTPKGIYCYKVIPLGLKNVGATYQRAMQRIFDDILHKNVEFYVDDLVVKSKEARGSFS
ncbi:UNVERIFIED_CONTAM: hypothetical protein Scaly_0475800 [Sesamum calycinum]|uniref:Reverse transcriptase domain-containing protein n=1 Tax=Sesamum calycinum TaxID=2727403 RepID=A0AAW2SFG6_9LAMI